MTAQDITKLIHDRCRNKGEHCFTELNIPGEKGRLDAWSIKPSWGKDQITGYEVKVNRHDFVQDDKWQRYLKTCNNFYFVCPTNLINISEVPESAGLFYVSEKLTVMQCKKKSPYREVDLDPSFLLGVLINRLSDNALVNKERTREERLKDAISLFNDEKKSEYLGRIYGHKLWYQLVETKNKDAELELAIKQFEEVKQFLESAGINTSDAESWKSFKEKLIQRLENESREFKRTSKQFNLELNNSLGECYTVIRNIEAVKNRMEFLLKQIKQFEQTEPSLFGAKNDTD
jgi:hypothetical protein